MDGKAKSDHAGSNTNTPQLELTTAGSERPNLKDPSVVLSLLEADQVVAAKRQTRFGRRNLSFAARMLLWGLRIYVIAMLVVVLISVLGAIHASP
ncbi:MAG: hypothetical protein ABSE45_09570 [Candidatus Acidiferrales bacterium]|jgi:hypothetical protein